MEEIICEPSKPSTERSILASVAVPHVFESSTHAE